MASSAVDRMTRVLTALQVQTKEFKVDRTQTYDTIHLPDSVRALQPCFVSGN